MKIIEKYAVCPVCNTPNKFLEQKDAEYKGHGKIYLNCNYCGLPLEVAEEKETQCQNTDVKNH